MEPRTLAYHMAGEGAPLVLVPGGRTGWISWIPHQERLSAHDRVIRLQPIHNELGSAGRPGDPGYSVEIERESLLLTVNDLGIERADFAGWSGGGQALLEFALTYPERVGSLTLIEPPEKRVVDLLGERLADARVVELDGDHASHIESMDRFLDELENHVHREAATAN